MNERTVSTDAWVAANCRASRRLFEVCGAAGAAGGPPSVAVALTELAGQFAWHAELYFDVLPVGAGIDRAALVGARVEGADDVLDRLAARAEGEDYAAACVVLARVVVPRLLAGAEAVRAVTPAALEGPLARTLTLVVRDLRDARSALEAICEGLLVDADVFDVGTAAGVDAERCLVEAGVAVGLCQVPPVA